jgi:hypothetical protein
LCAGAAIARLSRVIAAAIVLSLALAADLPRKPGSPETGVTSRGHATRVASDRAQLVDSLERLVRTGEPRHVTHDEGQELDAALKAALAAGSDPELQWLATRAAVPIVPAILHPLSSRSRPGSLGVRAERVLTLPWTVDYVADIDARLDDGAWQKIVRVKPGVSEHRSLGAVLRGAAIAPGFHTLALRARVRYGQLPAGMPHRETRDLLTLHYGIYGSARTATDPVRPLFDAAAAVSATTLDPNLPDVPLASWLNQLPRDKRGHTLIEWRTEWCGRHESMSGEGGVRPDVCVVARRGGPLTAFTETWIKVGALGSDDDQPRWLRKPPILVGTYVFDGLVRMRVPLHAVAGYLCEPADEWPSARLVVDAAGISVAPPSIVPGAPTTLRILVANMGEADANGVTINVLAASELNLSSTERTFVRTIRAGGSVEIEMPVIFPARYGIVDVSIGPGHDEIGPRIDGSNEHDGALAVINPRAAPPGYLQRIGRICTQNRRAAGFCSP